MEYWLIVFFLVGYFCGAINEYVRNKREQKESVFVHNKIEFPEYNDNLLEEFDKQFFEDGQDDNIDKD